MKILLLLLISMSGFVLCANAADLKFSIADIPAALMKNANSIIRVHETTFEVIDINKSKETVHYAITLLNNKAADEAGIKVYYDKTSSVSYLKFRIYNALGMDITRSFKKLEVTDESAIDGGTLYSDDRCKDVSPVFAQYPVTIEYSYEEVSSLIFSYPSWAPLLSFNMSLQEASFTLITPKSLKPRFKEVNQVPAAIVTGNEKSDTYSWKVSNLAAIEQEPFSPPFYEMVPYLLLAPGHISYQKYDESFQDWNELGEFIAFLIRDRNTLPAETISKLNELVKNCPDRKSKIKAVYSYMQKHTRYIGVQIGIGGWQPIPADYVDKKGYGDCKGLVNYTKALLNAVGIPSCYTLVYAGRNASPLITDFPCNRFNHIILCVPGDTDSTWLECTSQQKAFGFLGSFTDNRDALLISENGGKLVRTPAYTIKQNTGNRKVTVNLNETGDASVKLTTWVKGLESENVEAVMYDSPEDQKRGFYKRSGLADSKINSLKYTLTGDYLPEGSEEADLFVPSFASKSSNRLFMPVVLPDRYNNIPAYTVTRINPVVINDSFIDCDTLEFSVPDGFAIEFIPENQVINSKFGDYSLSVEKSGDKLICIRSFSIRENRFPADEYMDFIAYLKKVSKSDQTKVVMVKRT